MNKYEVIRGLWKGIAVPTIMYGTEIIGIGKRILPDSLLLGEWLQIVGYTTSGSTVCYQIPACGFPASDVIIPHSNYPLWSGTSFAWAGMLDSLDKALGTKAL